MGGSGPFLVPFPRVSTCQGGYEALPEGWDLLTFTGAGKESQSQLKRIKCSIWPRASTREGITSYERQTTRGLLSYCRGRGGGAQKNRQLPLRPETLPDHREVGGDPASLVLRSGSHLLQQAWKGLSIILTCFPHTFVADPVNIS